MSDADKPIVTTDTNDTFECAFYVDQKYPDQVKGWPESAQKVTGAAIARFLDEHPGSKVIEDYGSCIGHGDPRFPEGSPLPFACVRTIKVSVDKPLESLATREAELSIEQPVTADVAPTREAARQRLRAFEDEHIGPEAVRINGDVERGSGSLFQRLPEDKRRQHVALEHLVQAEDEVAKASAVLAAAETKHQAALANLARHEEAAHGGE